MVQWPRISLLVGVLVLVCLIRSGRGIGGIEDGVQGRISATTPVRSLQNAEEGISRSIVSNRATALNRATECEAYCDSETDFIQCCIKATNSSFTEAVCEERYSLVCNKTLEPPTPSPPPETTPTPSTPAGVSPLTFLEVFFFIFFVVVVVLIVLNKSEAVQDAINSASGGRVPLDAINGMIRERRKRGMNSLSNGLFTEFSSNCFALIMICLEPILHLLFDCFESLQARLCGSHSRDPLDSNDDTSYKALGDEESQGGGNLLDDVEDAQVGVAQAAGKDEPEEDMFKPETPVDGAEDEEERRERLREIEDLLEDDLLSDDDDDAKLVDEEADAVAKQNGDHLVDLAF